MKLFEPIYTKAMAWARHKYAVYYLAVLSFTESVIFPVPPDVMLAPMSLGKPNRAFFFAMVTTIASVLGGILGYILGYALFDSVVQPIITDMNYQDKFDHAMVWFKEWGVWVVFLAGFSPIPYKIFTISAGVLNMAFVPFLIASAIGRGMRFYLVAGLMKWGGQPMEEKLRTHIDTIGWVTILLAVGLYLIFR